MAVYSAIVVSSIILASYFSQHVSVTLNTSEAASNVPGGALDAANGSYIAGWASDPDFSGPIPVHIYIDDVIVEDELAASYRADVGAHAFHWAHAPFGAGNHNVKVYAIGVNSAGVPDGQNVLLQISSTKLQRVNGGVVFYTGCSGLRGSAAEWCANMPNYWRNRQNDTKLLWNDFVKIGINNSYGGMISQLYGSDRSKNLITEHGGGAMQVSLWGYDDSNPTGGFFGNEAGKCDPTAYSSQALCLANNASCREWGAAKGAHVADCVSVKYCGMWGAGAPWNPIQGQGPNCSWDSAANDVQYKASTADGGWEIRYNNPYQFTKTNQFTGLTLGQKVSLGDAYAKIEYSILYNGVSRGGFHPQEIPAIFLDNIKNKFYYYGGSTPFSNVNSDVTVIPESQLKPRSGDSLAQAELYLRLPGKAYPIDNMSIGTATEGWWGACDVTEINCVTIATFDDSAAEAVLGKTADSEGSGVLSLLGNFELKPGLQDMVTLYVFPYRYDRVVNGKSIRQRIYDLRYPLAPHGSLDVADATRVAGWAYKPYAPADPMMVAIVMTDEFGFNQYFAASTIGSRPDVNAALGITGNHGFNFATPPTFRNGGTYKVTVRAVDPTRGIETELVGSPKTFKYSP
jgi:hypothetical protein